MLTMPIGDSYEIFEKSGTNLKERGVWERIQKCYRDPGGRSVISMDGES